jgi:hypothetical protein
VQARCAASAAAERERVAACLRAVAAGDAAERASPALLRLCRERIGR